MKNAYMSDANEHGVFVDCCHKILDIVATKKCTAIIRVLNTVDGYIFATSASVLYAGASSPLSINSVRYETEAMAIQAGVDDLCRMDFIPTDIKAKIKKYTVEPAQQTLFE